MLLCVILKILWHDYYLPLLSSFLFFSFFILSYVNNSLMKHGILETAILPLAWEKETISNWMSWLAHLSNWNSVSMVSRSQNTPMKPVAVKSLSVSVSGRRIPQIYVMFSWASKKKSLSGQHLYYVHINSVGYSGTEIPPAILAVESRCPC